MQQINQEAKTIDFYTLFSYQLKQIGFDMRAASTEGHMSISLKGTKSKKRNKLKEIQSIMRCDDKQKQYRSRVAAELILETLGNYDYIHDIVEDEVEASSSTADQVSLKMAEHIKTGQYYIICYSYGHHDERGLLDGFGVHCKLYNKQHTYLELYIGRFKRAYLSGFGAMVRCQTNDTRNFIFEDKKFDYIGIHEGEFRNNRMVFGFDQLKVLNQQTGCLEEQYCEQRSPMYRQVTTPCAQGQLIYETYNPVEIDFQHCFYYGLCDELHLLKSQPHAITALETQGFKEADAPEELVAKMDDDNWRELKASNQ